MTSHVLNYGLSEESQGSALDRTPPPPPFDARIIGK